MSANFDPKKDAANIKKHRVSLSQGDGVLSDPLALTVEDDSAEGISVRKPDPKERRNYEKGV